VVTQPNRLIGIEGLRYASGRYTRGTTDPLGIFNLEQDLVGSCAGSGNGSGCSFTTYFGATFTLCGVALPPIPEKTEDGYITQYTLMDLVDGRLSDRTLVANNLARLVLTARSGTTDPANGIAIADSVLNGSCPTFDLHSTDLAGETAVFQSLAPRPLVSAADAQAYLDEKWNCHNAGIFMGRQNNLPDSDFPDAVSGAFNVFIDIHGQASGLLDFSTLSAGPFAGTVSFSGDLGPASFGSANYTVSAPGALKGMQVSFAIGTGNFVGGGWTSPDGQQSGTTFGPEFAASPISSVVRVGAVKSSVTIYRFVDKDLTWTSPTGGPTSWALDIEVDKNSVAKGTLQQFPQGSDQRSFAGTFANNLIEANYTGGGSAGAPPLSLIFDPTSNTLTGTLYGPDGTVIKTYTLVARMPGCRL
jgi:hypothetical protein